MNFSVLDLMSIYESPDVGGNVGRIEYVRNLDSDLTKVIRPNLDEVKYTYNNKQQVTKLEIPGMTVDYVYDINTQTLVEADNGAVNIIYNSAGGRPSLKMYTIGLGSISLQWNYDTLNGTGLMKEFVFDGDEIDYGYNSDLLLTSVGNLSIARTPTTGLVSGTTLGVVTDAYTYSSYAELATHESKAGATVLLSNTFTRDNLGRITQKVENNSGTTTTYVYGYDLLGRLETTTKNGSAWSSYVYDDHSNRTLATINGVTEASTYDAQDRLTSRGVWTYTYNDNGELATKTNTTTSETTTYTYNALGQLLSVALPGSGGTITYGMDAENKRFSRSDSVTPSANRLYLHDANGRVTAMLNGSGIPMQIYLYGTQSHSPDYMINSSLQMFRFVKDHLGNVRKVVRNNGTVVQNIDYDEFGRVTNDSNPGYQPFGYAGGIYDYRTGLVRFGARDYDSEVGRWASRDPILFAGGQTNLYSYTFGDPINFVDPSGLAACKYSISTHSMTCTSNDGSTTATLGPDNVFSGAEGFANDPSATGVKGGGPIPVGHYTIEANPSKSGFWDLRAAPLTRLLNFFNGNRAGFQLHLGRQSQGCITGDITNVKVNSDYSRINDMLIKDMGQNSLEVIE